MIERKRWRSKGRKRGNLKWMKMKRMKIFADEHKTEEDDNIRKREK
jgi:hypothetical protein